MALTRRAHVIIEAAFVPNTTRRPMADVHVHVFESLGSGGDGDLFVWLQYTELPAVKTGDRSYIQAGVA